MAANLPSSFASAAAGHARDEHRQQYSRTDSGDWSRKINGSGTFRRTSSTLTPQAQGTQNTSTPKTHNSQMPSSQQTQSWRGNPITDGRFSKDELLHIFRTQRASGDLEKHVDSLLLGEFATANSHDDALPGWTRKSEDQRNAPNVSICWDGRASSFPVNIGEMTSEERDLFTNSVNSTVKPPAQNAAKEATGTPSNSVGRKSSFTASYTLNSANGGRPTPRRRETSESAIGATNLTSPSGGSRFFRDDSANATSPPSLTRRRNELKENLFQPLDLDIPDDGAFEKSTDTSSPFATLLKRSTTGPMTALPSNNPASPWGAAPASATISSPMGTFGSFGIGGSSSDRAKQSGGLSRDNRLSQAMSRSSLSDVQGLMREKASQPNLGRVLEGDADSNLDDGMKEQMSHSNVINHQSYLHGNRQEPNLGSLAPAHPYGLHQSMQSAHQFSGQADRQPFQLSESGPLSPTTTNPYQSPDNARQTFAEPGYSGGEHRDAVGLGQVGYTEGTTFDQVIPGNRVSHPSLFAQSERTFGERSARLPNGLPKGNSGFAGLAGLGGMHDTQGWTGGVPSGTQERTSDGERSYNERTSQQPLESHQSPQFGGSTTSSFFGVNNGLNALPRNNKSGLNLNNSLSNSMMTADAELRERTMSGAKNPYNTVTMVAGFSDNDPDLDLRGPRGFFDPGTVSIHAREGFAGREAPLDRERGFTAADVNLANLQQDSAISTAYNQHNPPPNGGQSVMMSPNQNGIDQQQPNMPAAMLQPHQKIMVMPDRMRWVYQDPSGKVQGPFTGLEMHDWYKAGFFTPELLVKKAEDNDYEPLGQMIRRIGNSREPFLVPQVGVPHDPPAGQESSTFAGTTLAAAQQAPGSNSQPPFAGSFPSFGTTLTAEQQNALERRKQEEQYLMARQREYLVQQQVMQKQTSGFGAAGSAILQGRSSQKNLNHHASAHSLQSQPSFGSMTSPPLYQPQLPMQLHGSSAPGMYSMTPGSRLGMFPPGQLQHLESQETLNEEGLNRLLARQSISGQVDSPFDAAQLNFRDHPNAAHVAAALSQRQQLAQEQARASFPPQAGGFRQTPGSKNERLQEFNTLRGIADQAGQDPSQGSVYMQAQQPYGQSQPHSEVPIGTDVPVLTASRSRVQVSENSDLLSKQMNHLSPMRSSTEAFAAPTMEVDMPQPFPPAPQSSTPLPAPTPQKIRQPLSEALTNESHMMMQDSTVDVTTSLGSIAPWAKEVADASSKGPSLREIQESEAHRSALIVQAQESAMRERRQQLELERAAQPTPPAPAPGLPDSSTWAKPTATSGPEASTSPSVWSKAQKRANTSTTPAKSLAQIQKDEEDRAKRALATATVVKQASATAAPAGKRYSELASKAVSGVTTNPSSAAWSTIGAGGKVKSIPSGSSSAIGMKSGSLNPVGNSSAKARPVGSRATSTTVVPQTEVQTMFRKWAKAALKGLNDEINVDDFLQQLLSFPADSQLIAESVHANSDTIDSNRFAEEFIRKRRLADSGLLDSSAPVATQTSSTGGGWNEVAKKGPIVHNKESEPSSSYKVVSGKKRSTRK